MNKSPISYSSLSKIDKKNIIDKLYTVEHKSFADIALMYDTYPNKVRRDAKSLGIVIRNKSEAQKSALSTGKHKHPTKGTTRTQETKNKIGDGVMLSWDNLSETELQKRKETAKLNWDKMDHEAKKNMHKSAMDAVRVASKQGSKLEKFLLSKLLKSGFIVEFHKEQSLVNTKLQIDLFLPTINTVIEVDGPSHFEPVWGDASLKRNVSYDQKKEGLITGRGWNIIRVQQTRDFSKARANAIYLSLLDVLQLCQNATTPQKFTIKD